MRQTTKKRKRLLVPFLFFFFCHGIILGVGAADQVRKCELQVYFSSKDQGDDLYRSTLSLTNNREIPLSSWQVVWTFGAGNVIESGSLEGALSLSQGSADGAPARVVNNGGSDVIAANGGVRTFTFNMLSNTTLFPAGARAIGDVSFNGLTCNRFQGSSQSSMEQCPCHQLEEIFCLQEEREDFYGGSTPTADFDTASLSLSTSNVVEQCMASYCCGETFLDSPSMPPQEPEIPSDQLQEIIVYEDGSLLKGWKSLSTGGQFSFNASTARSGNQSIFAQITDKDGALVLHSEVPFGPEYGDNSFEFYIRGDKEIGVLQIEFYNLIGNDQKNGTLPDGKEPVIFTESLLEFIVDPEVGNGTTQVFSDESSKKWKLVQVPFDVVSSAVDPEESWDTFALRDVLGILSSFYVDDITIQTFAALDPDGGDPSPSTPSSDGEGEGNSTNPKGLDDEGGSGSALPIVIAVCVAVVVVAAVGLAVIIYMRKRKQMSSQSGSFNKRRDTLSRSGRGSFWNKAPASSSSKHETSRSTGVATGRSFSHAPSQGQLDIDFEREIKLGEPLGSGAFGTVHRGLWNDHPVAVKMMHGMIFENSSRDLVNFQQEVSVLSRLDHDHIIKFYGACIQPPKICLVEELAEGGSLHDLLHCNGEDTPLSYSATLKLGEEIASAMVYLHPTVVHRDLKSQNVLLDKDGKAKVCDFGIAKFKDHTFLTTRNVQAGTPSYMAPEMFAAGDVDEKCDVFSFAVLLWECITGKTPWGHYTSPMQIIFAVGVQRIRPEIPPDTPEMLSLLIQNCWEHSPSNRPSFVEVLERIQGELDRLGVETISCTQTNVCSLGLDTSPVTPIEEIAALISEEPPSTSMDVVPDRWTGHDLS